MTCPNCGASLPDNAAFCGNCGNRISQPPPPPEQTPFPQSDLQQTQSPPHQSPPPRQSPPMDFQQMQGTPFFLFAKPLFDAIDSGKFFRKPFVWLYIAFAVLNILYPLYFLFQLIDKGAFDYMGFSAVLILLLAAFAGWVGFQLWWNRKDKINAYSRQSDDFVATPTYTHWFQTAGEYIGTMIAIYGVGLSLISFLFTESRGMSSLPLPGFGNMGVVGIIVSPIIGFFVIVVTRMLAELWRALASIANNTKRMAETTKS